MVHIMKCKLPIEQIEMKEVFGGLEFGLTEFCFPSLGLGHKYELRVIFISRQHYCIILAASLKKVYSCILGRVVTIRLIIKKDKTLVCKKIIAIMF